MRKIDPDGIWVDFAAQLDEQAGFYDRSIQALPAVTDRKLATENYILTLGVLFEGYVNDLIFAYANRDCTKVMQHLEASVRDTLQPNSKASAAFVMFGEFKHRQHLKKDELRTILDPMGRNISFPTYSAVEDRAQQWLVPAHLLRFNRLTAQQKAVIDLTIAFRNNLAHRSKSSLDRLNDALDLGALHPTGLRRGVNRIQQAGNYLKSRVNGNARATLLAGLLRSSAQGIVV